ncbi:MAG: hypothetical protein ACK58Z_11250, partial [Pseudanabaena sp.]
VLTHDKWLNTFNDGCARYQRTPRLKLLCIRHFSYSTSPIYSKKKFASCGDEIYETQMCLQSMTYEFVP